MLCGVPASGKSTYIKTANLLEGGAMIYSTDNYIEKVAEKNKKTYNEVFSDGVTYKESKVFMDTTLNTAIKNDVNIIWDQTNLNPATRKNKIRLIPSHYYKIAINFAIPDEEEWNRRLNSRPGKIIPHHVLQDMKSKYIPATLEEGFDEEYYKW
jgi:predicted kinase